MSTLDWCIVGICYLALIGIILSVNSMHIYTEKEKE